MSDEARNIFDRALEEGCDLDDALFIAEAIDVNSDERGRLKGEVLNCDLYPEAVPSFNFGTVLSAMFAAA